MAAKRYSEYRKIVASHGRELLVRYRTSFSGYSEVSLNASCFIYSLLSTVYCLQSTVYCLLSTVYCLLSFSPSFSSSIELSTCFWCR